MALHALIVDDDPHVRDLVTQLLWICGDCGEHYPRMAGCPERCTACGAPREHMYAPIED